MTMRFPVHPTANQPMTGRVPWNFGPPDLYPSGENPNYDAYNMTRGRYLGALGNNAGADRGITDYPNELNLLSEVDDVQGNGIFDPDNTHGNIHPDSGIFAAREGIPGYLAREQFFQPSEVIDVNTGKPVMYVPGNSFMMDPRTQHTLDEISLYEPGLPSTGGSPVPQDSTVRPDQPAWPIDISGLGQDNGGVVERAPASGGQMFVAAGLAGLAVGLVAAMVVPKKRRR